MTDQFRIDGQKLQFHPHRVAQWLDGKDDWEKAKEIYPLYVEVSPVGACNHRCTFCAVDYIGYKSVTLNPEPLEDRIYEMGVLGVKSIMYAGEGEPLLHKHINWIVQKTKESNIDASFTTNGVLLNKLEALSECTWVKVSLNAGTRETYAKVHQTKESDFDKVIANLRDAVKRKGNCTIGAQMVLLPENEKEVDTLKAIGEDIGLDYVVIKPYSQHKFSVTRQYENFIPIVPQGTGKVIVRSESMQTTEIPYDKCQATPYLWSYVMATGDVYSCSAYLLDERFKLGNINEQSFKEIWQSEKRRQNWEYVRNKLDIKECRLNCRMDKSNRYLTDLVKVVPHQNFI